MSGEACKEVGIKWTWFKNLKRGAPQHGESIGLSQTVFTSRMGQSDVIMTMRYQRRRASLTSDQAESFWGRLLPEKDENALTTFPTSRLLRSSPQVQEKGRLTVRQIGPVQLPG